MQPSIPDGDYTYEWTITAGSGTFVGGTNGGKTSNAKIPTVIGLKRQSTEIHLLVKDNNPNGCQADGTVLVSDDKFYPDPIVTVSTLHCDGTATVRATDISAFTGASAIWSTSDRIGHWDIPAGQLPTNNQITYAGMPEGAEVVLIWTITSANKRCESPISTTVYNYGFTLPEDYYDDTHCSDDFSFVATLPNNDPTKYVGTWTKLGGSVASMTSTNNGCSLSLTGLSRSLDNVFEWHVSSINDGCEDTQLFTVRNSKPSDAQITSDRHKFTLATIPLPSTLLNRRLALANGRRLVPPPLAW